jgi:hypothetical protein
MTSTFPFEIWRYRHLEGVDEDVNLEFIDKTSSGEYRLTTDPCEKDALANVPGARPTQMESLGLSTRTARLGNTNGTTCGAPLGGQTEKMDPFRRMEVASKVFRAPAIKFDDLKGVVDSTVSYNLLPIQVQVYHFPITEASVLTYITIQFENRDLQFQMRDGVQAAAVNILGKISTLSRRPVAPFEATVVVNSPPRMLGEFIRKRSIYSTTLPLAPGTYRLDVAAKDVVGGNLAHYQAALTVPHLDPQKLQTSGIVLADVMEKVSLKSIGVGQFVIGDSKVRPRVDARFDRGERLGAYCKVYGVGTGLAGGGSSGQVEYEIVRAGTEEKVYSATEDFPQGAGAARGEFTIERFVELREFAPGSYTIRLKITDAGSGRTVSPSASFTVL